MGNVYFVQCEGLVKIGYATDVAERLLQLQTGNPFGLTLLAVIPDALPSLEKHLHRAFADMRERGEWFRYNRHLSAFVEHIQAGARPRTPADIAFFRELRLYKRGATTLEDHLAEGRLHKEFRDRVKMKEPYVELRKEFMEATDAHRRVVETFEKRNGKLQRLAKLN